MIPVQLDYTFQPGTNYFTNPIIIRGQTGMTVQGKRHNAGVSRMVYRGPPTLAPIQFIGCTRCTLQNLEIVDEAGCDATVLFTNTANPSAEGYSTGNRCVNVRVMNSGNGKASRRAFSIDPTALGGPDANNDHHAYIDCGAYSYTEAGFYIIGSQSHDTHYVRCQAHDHGGRKPIGLHAAGAVFFAWERGGMNSNSTDFKLGTPETQAIINGQNSENGQRFLTAELSGVAFVRATDVRWDGKPALNSPVVSVKGPGPWSISNSYFAGINGVCPLLRFTGPSPGSLDLSGVMIRQHGGTVPTTPIVTCPATWERRELGLIHQMITADDKRVTKAIDVNQVTAVT